MGYSQQKLYLKDVNGNNGAELKEYVVTLFHQ